MSHGYRDKLSADPSVAPGHIIGGPLTQRTFTFNPELPAYNILNTRIGTVRWEAVVRCLVIMRRR